MTTRYTNEALQADIVDFNTQLEKVDSEYYMEAGSRYNYSAVDVLTKKQYAWRKGDRETGQSGVYHTLKTGTPRECCAKAESFFWQQMAASKEAKQC